LIRPTLEKTSFTVYFIARVRHFTMEMKHFTVEMKNPTLEMKHFTMEMKNSIMEVKHFTMEMKNPTVEMKHFTVEVKNPTVEVKIDKRCLRHPMFKKGIFKGHSTAGSHVSFIAIILLKCKSHGIFKREEYL